MNIFKELSRNSLIIITSHNNDIEGYSDYIIDLENDSFNKAYDMINGISNIKEGKCLVNYFLLLKIHYNAFKNNIFQFIFSIIVLAINLAIIILSISINTYDLDRYLNNFIIDNNLSSMIIFQDKNNRLELNNYQINYLYDFKTDITELKDYKENEYYNK